MAKDPAASEDDLRELTVDELRHKAKQAGISHNSEMRKEELVSALVANAGREGGGSGHDDESGRGAGPDAGHVRRGSETSRSLKYSQEISSPDDEPERPGRSLVTTHHDVIREWAEARGGRPATVEGSEHGDHLGVLRFDFGDATPNLRHVSWDEWFATFDDRRLNFIYQEEKTDGRQSNFFRLENPEREDA
ncbi:MAG TPA: Rho termination factor N-terminal domain-containing protein [Propionibacteriaceae bacterium]|nr:Rho termination factor N-terminal domain-containing protein [Propionibacteriaceae bacterium]